MTLEDLLMQCTVRLSLPGQLGWGTGFFVAPGFILTCAHVVKALVAPHRVQVRWQHQIDFAEAKLVQHVPALDLALLQFTPRVADLPCVYLDEELQAGQDLYFFGYPDKDFENGCPVTCSYEGLTGDISPLIKFKLAQVRPGMSGSALLNRHTGKVCGMVKFTRDRSSDLGGGAIPTRVILEQFPELRELQREFHWSDRCWNELLPTMHSSETLGEQKVQQYLQSLSSRYEKWWDVYCLTEVISARQSTFTFEPMAQTEEKKTEDPTKTETVLLSLQGIIDYAQLEPVLLVGSPGVGKSTTLLRLLAILARQELRKAVPRIPVLIRLKDYQASFSGSEDTSGMLALIKEALEPELSLEISDIKALLFQKKRLFLLLDGLNEIPADIVRSKLTNFRDQCRSAQVPLICTTRNLGDDLGIQRKVDLQPLSPKEINRFLSECMPGQEQQVLQLLNKGNQELGKTPFILWMLYDIFRNSGQVPESLGEAFSRFTKNYTNYKINQEGIPYSQETLQHWNFSLEYLAFEMLKSTDHQDPGIIISERQSANVLTHFPSRNAIDPIQAKVLLNNLLKYHLLQKSHNGEVSFCHQLIQEYYAAEHLLAQLNQHPKWLEKEDGQDYTHFQKKYLNYLKWTEPIALMLGLVGDEAIEQVMRVVKLAIEVDLMLGARLVGSVRACSQPRTINLLLQLPLLPKLQISCLAETISDEAIPALLQFLEYQALETRMSAIDALAVLGSNAAILEIVKALKDKSLDVIDVASDALESLDPSISIPLSCQLLEDEDPDLRKIAVEILGEHKHFESQPQLLEKLKDPDLVVRHSSAIALGEMGCKDSIPHLLEILDPPYSSSLSWRATRLLGKLGDETALPNLINALNSPHAHERSDAAQLLGEYNSESAVFGLLDALEDEEVSVRLFASMSLKKINKEVSIPVLFNLVDNEKSKVSKRAAIKALEEIGDEIAIPKLTKALEDDDYSVQNSAAHALVQIGSKSPVPDLIQLLKHQNPFVRSNAALVLGKIGCDSAIPELVQASLHKTQDMFVRIDTLIALGMLGNTNAIIQLLWLLELLFPILFFRAETFEVLGELKEKISDTELLSHLNKAATSSLLLALKYEESYVRMTSALALGKIGNIDTVPELIQALADENKYVRKCVVDSLGEIGAEAAIPGLLELFEEVLEEDEDWAVHRSVANALEKIGGEKTIQGLLRTLENNTNWYTRRDAINILGNIGFETIIPRLLNVLKNEDTLVDRGGGWEICSSTIDVLTKMCTPDYLADLWDTYFQNPEIDLTRTIYAIQNRCQFYNYEIWQAHLIAQEGNHQTHPSSVPNAITIQTVKSLTIMTDKAPIFNQQHATIGVNYAAEGSKVEFIQHTNSSEQTFEILLTDYQQFIQQLQQKYPTLSDVTTIPQVIEVEAKLIEARDRQRWQNFLDLKRLWHGSKKAGFKIGEHFAENNVWAKGAIAFLEGISEDGK
jgi:HEAT repeat protein